MKRRATVFSGAARSALALALVTTRELTRDRTLGLLFFLYLVFVACFRMPIELEGTAATARFLDYTLTGFLTLMLMSGVFAAVSFRKEAAGGSDIVTEVSRLIGPAAWYWGRLLGVIQLLVALAFLLVLVVGVHHAVRFGDPAGRQYAVQDRIHSSSFASRNSAVYLREDRASASFDFPYTTTRLAGRRFIRGRFAPRLIVAKDGDKVRSFYPVRLRCSAPEWEQTTIVNIQRGKASTFTIASLPPGEPSQVRITVEKISPLYVIKVDHEGLTLMGGAEALVPSLLRGALATALYASIVAAVTLFFAWHFSTGTGLLVGVGLVVLLTSLDVLELSLLADSPPLLRTVTLESVRAALPDFTDYDVAELLARQIRVGWDMIGELVLRLVLTGLLLGTLCGLAGHGGGRR